MDTPTHRSSRPKPLKSVPDRYVSCGLRESEALRLRRGLKPTPIADNRFSKRVFSRIRPDSERWQHRSNLLRASGLLPRYWYSSLIRCQEASALTAYGWPHRRKPRQRIAREASLSLVVNAAFGAPAHSPRRVLQITATDGTLRRGPTRAHVYGAFRRLVLHHQLVEAVGPPAQVGPEAPALLPVSVPPSSLFP
jgi:hypothetical protein